MAGVTRVGATKQYSDNWETIFGGKRRSSGSSATKAAKPSAKRKTAKKKAPKKARAK
jgi:hypothetical protein